MKQVLENVNSAYLILSDDNMTTRANPMYARRHVRKQMSAWFDKEISKKIVWICVLRMTKIIYRVALLKIT